MPAPNNIIISGNIYNSSGVKFSGDGVKYQAYFKQNSAVDPNQSAWGSVLTSILGQYNFNIADIIGTNGVVINNDRVVVVFWTPPSAYRDDICSALLEWGSFEIILGTGPGMSLGGNTYVNDVQIEQNRCPHLTWSLQSEADVAESVTAVNNSDDTHSWDFIGPTTSGVVSMQQINTLYTTLQTVNSINNSTYDWGDITQDVETGITNGVHTWSAAGDYDVELVIEDECGCTVTGTDSIRIFWREPSCSIEMIPNSPVDPNVPVVFNWAGTDPDNTITSIDWVINDGATTTITSGTKDADIYHTEGLGTAWCDTAPSGGAFTNSGDHLVSIVINWNDGFDDQISGCSDTFTQELFTGPTVSFSQDPFPATVGSGIKFVNTTTNTDRVGSGLPDCTEYIWTFTDDGVETVYSGVSDSYELEVDPTSTDCQVELCAMWSDGFSTRKTCTYSGVPFRPYVTISVEDCYYNLNVVGTSNDGTVTGYSWTVWSGAGETGPWTDIWSSPIGMDQNDKKVCFTSQGWYKATGYVYGGGTLYDDDTVDITQVCPTAISGAVTMIWNGTGPLDDGTDWTHSGYGSETTEAMHAGTYGLDATGMSKNDVIYFSAGQWVDISYFDMLVFWVNIREWQANKDLEISFHEHSGGTWRTVNLGSYTNVFNVNEIWRKIYIPLDDFSITSSMVDILRFTSTGNIGVWLDDIAFSMGNIIGIPICEPDMYGDEWGQLSMKGHELKPSLKAKVDTTPSARIINTFPYPTNL